VEEVVQTDKRIRVAQVAKVDFRVHYLVCDASGDLATIEFLGGKLRCHRGDELPVKALTNDTYRESLEFLRRGDGVGGDKNHASLNRFSTAATCAQGFKSSSPADDRDYALNTLKRVSNQGTMWSIVYDIGNRRIHYRTRQNAELRWLSLSDVDFGAQAEPVFIDVNASGEGDVAPHVQPLTHDSNEQYLLDLSRREDVRERLGNLTPLMKPLCALLRTYRPAE
jgi:choloylglycine hydrolase